MRKTNRTRALWTVTLLYWLLLFISTHIPGGNLPTVPVSDKTEHLVGYGLLGSLLLLSIWSGRTRFSNAPLMVLGIGMMYGAIDEWLQALPFVHRDCDRLDWFADTTGLAIAVILLTTARALRG